MSHSKVFLLLCSFSALAAAGAVHSAPVANEGATQRRAELREALQRRNVPAQDGVTPVTSERQLTTEERAELRRQLRTQQKSQ